MSIMLIANDIKSYSSFRTLDTEVIYVFERVTTKGTIVKLRSHHANRVSNICKYVSCLDLSGKVTIADDPTTWDTGDFKARRHQGKSTLNIVTTSNAPLLVATGTTTATSAAEKQQKVDDNKLQSWRRNKKRRLCTPRK